MCFTRDYLLHPKARKTLPPPTSQQDIDKDGSLHDKEHGMSAKEKEVEQLIGKERFSSTRVNDDNGDDEISGSSNT